jgi:hypothetical protein
MATRDTTRKRNTIDPRHTDIREQKIVPPNVFNASAPLDTALTVRPWRSSTCVRNSRMASSSSVIKIFNILWLNIVVCGNANGGEEFFRYCRPLSVLLRTLYKQ